MTGLGSRVGLAFLLLTLCLKVLYRLLGMCVGEKYVFSTPSPSFNLTGRKRRKLKIPSELGYGSRGAGGAIPPDSVRSSDELKSGLIEGQDLVFDVELLAIKNRGPKLEL